MTDKAKIREKFDALQEKVFDYLYGEMPEDDTTACCMASPFITGNESISQTFAAFIGPRRAERLLDICRAFRELREASEGWTPLQEVVLTINFPMKAYENEGVPKSLGSDDYNEWEANMRWLPQPSDDEPCEPFRFDPVGMSIDEDGIKIEAYSHYGDGKYEFKIYSSTLKTIANGPEARQEAAPNI